MGRFHVKQDIAGSGGESRVSTLPALGQELPDGPGKELAVANCNICHTLLSRVGAGYTPEGWNTVLP